MSEEKRVEGSSAGKALSKLGASKGGKARAAKLSPENRREIARNAVLARWGTEGKGTGVPVTMFGAPDKPLVIGDIEIPAYVLPDGLRVLAQRGLQTGIGLSRSGGKGGARRIVALMNSLERKGVDTKGLAPRANSPIRFVPPRGEIANGYEATILPDICAVLIEAGRVGALTASQAHFARQAAILQHGFSTVGIIALVDEVTGYQKWREQNALTQILEKFVARELRPWVRTFPPEFYEELYRLKGWDYSKLKPNSPKPLEVGRLTDDLVYKRLAPGDRDELRRLTPRSEKGYLKHKLHRRLTADTGAPKLEKHIGMVVAIAQGYPDGDFQAFYNHLKKALPRYDKNLELPLND